MNWIDGHCHLSDERIFDQAEFLIQSSVQSGIETFVMGGVDPDEWQRQLVLKSKWPERIWTCFGLHPYFVAKNDFESALNELSAFLPKADFFGEIGLDLRTPYVDSREKQIEAFELQLEMADLAQKPVVLHFVRCFPEVQRIFLTWGAPKKGFVHAFSGSAQEASYYLQQGLYLSVGGAVTRPQFKALHEAVVEIPLERLIIESDSPDQAPQDWSNSYNTPQSILVTANKVAELKRCDPREILDSSRDNLRKLKSYF